MSIKSSFISSDICNAFLLICFLAVDIQSVCSIWDEGVCFPWCFFSGLFIPFLFWVFFFFWLNSSTLRFSLGSFKFLIWHHTSCFSQADKTNPLSSGCSIMNKTLHQIDCTWLCEMCCAVRRMGCSIPILTLKGTVGEFVQALGFFFFDATAALFKLSLSCTKMYFHFLARPMFSLYPQPFDSCRTQFSLDHSFFPSLPGIPWSPFLSVLKWLFL